MHTEPQQEHRWLERLVGDWALAMTGSCGPEEPEAQFTGADHVRSLGGMWVVCEGTMGDAHTLMTLGYDPARQCYVGSFLGTMMAHLWVYEGRLDASGQALELFADGPDFRTPGTVAKYRDTIAFQGDDLRTLSSHVLGDDGEWHHFMTATYRRTA